MHYTSIAFVSACLFALVSRTRISLFITAFLAQNLLAALVGSARLTFAAVTFGQYSFQKIASTVAAVDFVIWKGWVRTKLIIQLFNLCLVTHVYFIFGVHECMHPHQGLPYCMEPPSSWICKPTGPWSSFPPQSWSSIYKEQAGANSKCEEGVTYL